MRVRDCSNSVETPSHPDAHEGTLLLSIYLQSRKVGVVVVVEPTLSLVGVYYSFVTGNVTRRTSARTPATSVSSDGRTEGPNV